MILTWYVRNFLFCPFAFSPAFATLFGSSCFFGHLSEAPCRFQRLVSVAANFSQRACLRHRFVRPTAFFFFFCTPSLLLSLRSSKRARGRKKQKVAWLTGGRPAPPPLSSRDLATGRTLLLPSLPSVAETRNNLRGGNHAIRFFGCCQRTLCDFPVTWHTDTFNRDTHTDPSFAQRGGPLFGGGRRGPSGFSQSKPLFSGRAGERKSSSLQFTSPLDLGHSCFFACFHLAAPPLCVGLCPPLLYCSVASFGLRVRNAAEHREVR